MGWQLDTGDMQPLHAEPVSYTHLDVYKRQALATTFNALSPAMWP